MTKILINKIRLFFLTYRLIYFKGLLVNGFPRRLNYLISRNNKAAVLWTGGKDCNLALYESQLLGFEITCLVGFINTRKDCSVDSLSLMNLQAESLNIPLITFEVSGFNQIDYIKAITLLKKKFGIQTIVTGIISNLKDNIFWLKSICKDSDVSLYCPLWKKEKILILNKLISLEFEVIFISVRDSWFTSAWLGQKLSPEVISNLKSLQKINHFDLCGEKDEYNTLVLNGPIYNNRIDFPEINLKKHGDLIYCEFENH